MDDKILFYIILGIIYFLFSRLKKKKPEETENDQPELPKQGPKPLSFEDLLKEITEAKKSSAPQPVAEKVEYEKPKPKYVDYDDEIEEEEKSLEKVTFDEDKITKTYEEAKRQAFNRPSLEETLKLENVKVEYSKFAQFDRKPKNALLLDYVKDLRDRKGFKKALVLSEILNRKHF
jgi:hypothetical protein